MTLPLGGRGAWHWQKSTSWAQNMHCGSNLKLREPWFPTSAGTRNGLDLPPVSKSAGQQASAIAYLISLQRHCLHSTEVLLIEKPGWFALLLYINSNFFKSCFPQLLGSHWIHPRSLGCIQPKQYENQHAWPWKDEHHLEALACSPFGNCGHSMAQRCRGIQLHHSSAHL